MSHAHSRGVDGLLRNVVGVHSLFRWREYGNLRACSPVSLEGLSSSSASMCCFFCSHARWRTTTQPPRHCRRIFTVQYSLLQSRVTSFVRNLSQRRACGLDRQSLHFAVRANRAPLIVACYASVTSAVIQWSMREYRFFATAAGSWRETRR